MVLTPLGIFTDALTRITPFTRTLSFGDGWEIEMIDMPQVVTTTKLFPHGPVMVIPEYLEENPVMEAMGEISVRRWN